MICGVNVMMATWIKGVCILYAINATYGPYVIILNDAGCLNCFLPLPYDCNQSVCLCTCKYEVCVTNYLLTLSQTNPAFYLSAVQVF